MSTRRPIPALLIAALIFALTTSAQARRVPPPEHDWTFRVGGDIYGVRQQDSMTLIVCGPGHVWIRAPIYQLALLVGLPLVCVVFLTSRALRSRRQRDENEAV